MRMPSRILCTIYTMLNILVPSGMQPAGPGTPDRTGSMLMLDTRDGPPVLFVRFMKCNLLYRNERLVCSNRTL